MRKVAVFSVSFTWVLLATSIPSPQPSPLTRYVNRTDPTCGGHLPCYPTIQAAVDAVQPGETIRVQAGEYLELVVIKGKNNSAGATEADRIVIEADPTVSVGSVVLGGASQKCNKGNAIQIESSKFITLRGLTITHAGGQAVVMAGGNKKKNTAIRLERNRIFSNGTNKCQGGVLIGVGNTETVLVNNLLYDNGRQGVAISRGKGGPHFIVGNTIHGNGRSGIEIGKGQEVWLLNNVIIGNGTDPKSAAKDGFGVKREEPERKGQPEHALLLNNLICGNASGELKGPLLDGMDAGNLTPTGSEGPGVSASPGCELAEVVYANVNGQDGAPNTMDDDFTLATAAPAIDRGVDPRQFDFGAPTSVLEADYLEEGTRPQDGDGNGTAEFDMGALERTGSGGGGCTAGETRSCYEGPEGTEGVGICQAGLQTCGAGGSFGACVGQILPETERCNGEDDNCNGQTDEGLGQTTCGVGACARTVNNCENGQAQTCTPGTPGPTEVCGNSADEDCDGEIDDPDVCESTLPPDPSTVAPPLDRSVATTTFAATEFLYTGADPIQTGVTPGTIDSKRAAVLRGKVLDKTNTPLPGVTISVLDHPEFGQTLSRADGMFDLVVNGGGPLTVKYQKAGFLPAQRQAEVPWQDYVMLPDVVLIQLDSQVTEVDLTAPGMKVARSSVMTDSDGARQTTLLFLPGTTATMRLPDNSTQELSTLHVRATEYTVGSNGPNAMPGDLPPTSFYTYAVEYSVDEAVAAGALEVTFSQPVIQYNENFLNFPVGTVIPSGAYDPVKGQWIASDSGRVVKILTITGGAANLDVTGNNQPATDAEYAQLGITVAERQTLATLYAAGQTLWRVPILHFSKWDSNWGWGPPGDAAGPSGPPPPCDTCNDCPEEGVGCVLQIGTQALGEEIAVTGTPYFLRYSSERQRGRLSNRSLKITLSEATIPTSLKRIDLTVSVAGRVFEQSFPAQPNQTTTFEWDGMDAYGREVQGRQPATVEVGYTYDGVYQNTDRFGYNGNGIPITGSRTRREVTLSRIYHVYVGNFDGQALGLGGWTLSEHHSYDPIERVLYEGNGTRRSVQSINGVISTVGGTGGVSFSGDGGPATQATFGLFSPQGAAVAPDGSVYVADTGNRVIRRIAPNGVITTVAGVPGVQCNPTTNPCGDGGQALQAQFSSPFTLAFGPDGSYYVVDNSHRIRKVAPNGIVTTVAGTGAPCASSTAACGDEGPATQAQLNLPLGVTVASDGAIYISDSGNRRIRRVGPDGIITTVAGSGDPNPGSCSNNDVPARQACLGTPFGVVVASDGALYFSDGNLNQLFRVGPNGIINLVAGDGACAFSGDGGPATSGRLCRPEGITRGPDNAIYIADWNNNRIRRVGPDGILTTVAGNGSSTYGGDGGPATAGQIRLPLGVAFGLDGSFYIADGNNQRVRHVTAPLPGFDATDIAIPSADGSELYRFNSEGRHLDTRNTLTGATEYTFNYDTGGRLISVTDGDNNVTTIQRDGSGNPTGIVSPFNQTTGVSLDANGYLATITNPNNETNQFTYTADGLLTQKTDPRGNQTAFTYDALGRLIRDDDPAGGFQTLARTEQATSYSVTHNTALNRTTDYRVENLATGDRQRLTTDPAGLQTQLLEGANGIDTTTDPDGTVTTETLGPDPRWRMQAPITAKQVINTPGGLTSTTTTTRTVTLADPADPLSLTSMTDTININGRFYTRFFNAVTRTDVETSPQGRQTTTVIDLLGRPTQIQISGLLAQNFTYDTRGRLATITQGSGAEERLTTLNYNSQGFLSSLVDPLNRTVSFTHDAAGRVLTETLPDSRVIAYTYDANGNLASITPPGRPAHVFDYTPVDLIAAYNPPSVTGGGTNQTLYAYNLDRQIDLVTRPDGQTLDYVYDSAGRLSTLAVPSGQYTYAYDPTTGNLVSINAPDGGTLSHSYDGSLLKDTSWTGTVVGTVSRTYNNNFRMNNLSVNGSGVGFAYDNDNFLIQAGNLALTRNAQHGLISGTTLEGITDSWGYNGFGELTSYSAFADASEFYNVQYTRDKLGRIAQKVETIGGTTTTFDYDYDLAGRLIEVKQNGATTASYTYDSNSNRLSGPGLGAAPTYDAQDRLLTYAGNSYTYTANGELVSKTNTSTNTSTTYTYDVLGNLRSVAFPGGTQIDYVIDGQNRRIGKKVNNTLVQGFLYQDGLRIVAELDGNNNVISRFVYGSRANVPAYMIKGGVRYRIIADHLGSPRLVVAASDGTIVQRMDYDEFGNVMQDTNPGFQPFGFAGGLYDPQTKLVRFGARDYDAETGRWTSKDPVLFVHQATNLYEYAYSDPVNFIDLSGQAPNPVEWTAMAIAVRIKALKNEIKKLSEESTKIRKKKKLCKKDEDRLAEIGTLIAQKQEEIRHLEDIAFKLGFGEEVVKEIAKQAGEKVQKHGGKITVPIIVPLNEVTKYLSNPQ